MAEFIDKLRMQNIFPAGGGPRTSTPFGMPDMNSGSGPDLLPIILHENELNRQHQLRMAGIGRQPHLNNIGNSMAQPQGHPSQLLNMGTPQDDPMSQVIPGMHHGQSSRVIPPGNVNPIDSFMHSSPDVLKKATEYQKGELALGQQKLKQAGELGYSKLSQQGDIASRKADLAEKIADGKATDAEKQEYKLAQIDLGAGYKSDQIGQQGNIRKDLQGTRGQQRLTEIAANVAGRKEVQAEKPVKPETSGNAKTRHFNAGNEMLNTRPDLAPFLKFNPDSKTYDVVPPRNENDWFPSGPTPQQFKEINDKLYGSSTSEPVTKKPTNKPVEKPVTQSKYKVAIE